MKAVQVKSPEQTTGDVEKLSELLPIIIQFLEAAV
jgi:hypothetical protein